MGKKVSIDQNDLERFEKKLKLEVLEAEKKFVDLQLSVGKMEEKLKELSEGFPQLKENKDNLDSLVHAIVLGIRDFKKTAEELGKRVSGIEALPKKVDGTLVSFNEKLQNMETNINKISEDLQRLNSLKDEISKSIEGSVLPSINAIREGSDRNKLQIEDLKKDVDNFASLIKSFQRTLELTDIDSVIRRFDSINSKITNLEMQMDDARSKMPDMSVVEKEMDFVNTRMQELSNAVIDRDGRVKEIEVGVNIIKNKIQEMDFLGTISGLKSELKEKEKMILKTQMKDDEFSAKLDKVSDDVSLRITLLENTMKKTKHIGLIEDIAKDVQEQVSNLHETGKTVEQLSDKVEKMYFDMAKKLGGMEELNNEIKKLKASFFEMQSGQSGTPEILDKKIDEMRTKLIRLNDFDKKWMNNQKIILDLEYKINEFSKKLVAAKSEVEISSKRIAKVEHDIKTASVPIDSTERLKELEKKVALLDNAVRNYGEKPAGSSKPLEDEIESLKKIVMGLGTENKELRGRLKGLMVQKEEQIPAHLIAEALTKIESLEEKVKRIQKRFEMEVYEHPIILE